MNRVAGLVIFVGLALPSFLPVGAQLRSPLDPVEPFAIKPGSSFMASGGSISAVEPSMPSAIGSDLREAIQLIRQNYIAGRSLDPSEMTRTALDGMLRSLDPHSNFYDAAEWKDLMDEQRSSYSGIGASIAGFEKDGVIETYVIATFANSPAARAQLHFGDKILAIDGQRMKDRASEAVRDKIRGPNGTFLRLTILRASTGRTETIAIRRGRVPQPSIPDAYMLRPGVGYIELSEGFNYTTADEFEAALADLKRQGATSLVLDLRGNGGGIVDQAVKVAEKFLPAGTLILTQRGRAHIDNRIWRSADPSPETMPLVVLVDQETASASEIVAGAFQDNDRAMIVGDRTFGKGLVQSVIGLPGGAGLTLTSARYLTPSGRSIQRDYSRLDLYDYFHHKTPLGAAGSSFAAHTLTDRVVFGGDGIQPDEMVRQSTLTETQIALLDPLFFFVRDLAAGKVVSGHESYRPAAFNFGQRTGHSGIQVSDQMISEFNEFALKTGKFSPESLKDSSAFIRLRLRYNLAVASLGTIAADRVLDQEDPQIAAGLAALPRAARLFDLAARAREHAQVRKLQIAIYCTLKPCLSLQQPSRISCP